MSEISTNVEQFEQSEKERLEQLRVFRQLGDRALTLEEFEAEHPLIELGQN